MAAGIPGLPPPIFVNDADRLDVNLILSDMIAGFEAAAGRTLQPAQVERLLINLYAYRESLIRNAIQYAAQQNLLAFAAFPMLDFLGGLVGVTRLEAVAATTTLQFTLANSLSVQYVIAPGTSVGTNDGAFQFTTDTELVIAAGVTIGTVNATATVAGPGGNGFLAGQINVPLSPSALIANVANTTTSGGGSAPETDDHLRARIQLAPSRFSNAGPAGAYRFFAIGADPAIIDAQVVSSAPGTVDVYILTGPITVQPAAAPNAAGVANAALISKVQAALDDETVRPLTDTVIVHPVAEVDYQIIGTITMFADADPVATMAAANAAAQQFAIKLASRTQRDIVPSEIIAALSVAGVYDVALTSPTLVKLTPGQWANCTAITLGQVIGTEHS